jgi:glycerol-3-phosphate cytidylyltransferase
MTRVITFGTFDLFHIGHKRILEKSAEYGDYLIVGVSSDELNISKKNRKPIYSIKERLEIISCIKFVDETFIEESLDKKREYILKYNAKVMIIGDDWEGKFDDLNDICKVVYLPRTPSISTTDIIEKIK